MLRVAAVWNERRTSRIMLALTIEMLTLISLVLVIAVYILQLYKEYRERKHGKPPI